MSSASSKKGITEFLQSRDGASHPREQRVEKLTETRVLKELRDHHPVGSHLVVGCCMVEILGKLGSEKKLVVAVIPTALSTHG